MKIVFTTQLPLQGFNRLENHQLWFPKTPYLVLNEDDRLQLQQADILVATFDYSVSAELLAMAPNLMLVANFGVGFNNIDLDYCRKHNIRVTNTPLPVIEPTAELAFSLMHAVARRTAELDRRLRTHTADPFGVMNNLGHSLYGKQLGIIGMGRIGMAVARRAQASGMTIVYHNRHQISAEQLVHNHIEATYLSMDELLRTSDFVSLHLPYTPEVHHLIDAEQLHLMKSTAFLINTARGAHVCEKALIEALTSGQIAGAALDVYEAEPSIAEQLLTLDNVVLSPHVGTGTWEGRIDMCHNVEDNILAFANHQFDKMNIVL